MQELRILFPADGDCLNEYDGTVRDGTLRVTVKVASAGPVTVNGRPAVEAEGCRTAEVSLTPGQNQILAQTQRQSRQITVFWLQDSTGKYRLSSDDNIVFLWDIHRNRDKYTSIFDNPYLAMYRKAHELYGAKVHLNLFYELPHPCSYFGVRRGPFDLSMMTDRFREEWIANADWLKLNFHARSNEPACPYRDADYRQVYADGQAVQREIVRFAGRETLSEETTLHWGACTREGVRALRDLGIRTLAGYFWVRNNEPMVAYCYPPEQCEQINKRDFWYDADMQMRYGVIDDVMNLHTLPENLALLDQLYAQKTRAGFLELMIHEEFFYEDYLIHIPDYEQIVLSCCRWAAGKGYRGAFLNEAR